jgi:hypothetical protein
LQYASSTCSMQAVLAVEQLTCSSRAVIVVDDQ